MMTRGTSTIALGIACAAAACLAGGCRALNTQTGIVIEPATLRTSSLADVMGAMRSWRYPDTEYKNSPDPWPSYDAMREAMAARVIEIYLEDTRSLPPRERERAEIMAELARNGAVVVGMPIQLVYASWGYPTGAVDVTKSPQGTSVFARWSRHGTYGTETSATASFHDDVLTWWTIE